MVLNNKNKFFWDNKWLYRNLEDISYDMEKLP